MKYIEIKKEDLVHNISKLKECCEGAEIIAVLKGNAYGIDMLQFGKILLEEGINTFAVSDMEEALALREAGFENTIILLTPPNGMDEAKLVADNKITATAGSMENLRLLNSIGVPIDVHIKIDTGFGRYGFYNAQLSESLKGFENITYTGVYSHFSNSFGKDDSYSHKQFEVFKEAIEILKSMGISPKLQHICNSCGAIKYKFAHLNGVRIGSAFLGRLPISNTLGLRKIATLKCSVSEIRTLKAGTYVGYANTYKTKTDIISAVIPIGYKDGYGVEKVKDTFRFIDVLRYMFGDFKSVGKKLYVSLGGRQCPVIGRVSMHNIVVDITGADVRIGDIATLDCNPILIKTEIKRVYM